MGLIGNPVLIQRRFVDAHMGIIKKDVRKLWKNLRETVTKDEVEKWVRYGEVMLEWDNAMTEIYKRFQKLQFEPVMMNDLYDAGTGMMKRVDKAVGKCFVLPWETKAAKFSSTTQRILDWLRRESSKFIVDITDNQREAVRFILKNGLKQSLSSMVIRERIMQKISLLPREVAWTESYFDRAIEAGVEPKRAIAMTEKYTKFLENLRAERISRTETIAAYNRGNDECMEQARDAGIIKDFERVWETADTERTCDECAALDGKVTTQIPPLHPNCGCGIDYVLTEA